VIIQAMHALEGMCLRMRAGTRMPDGDLSKMLDFIRNFADGFHHAKEETHLFPALEQLGIEGGNGPLATSLPSSWHCWRTEPSSACCR
jgi:hemerythrin-like domain-containing protein